MSLNFNQGLTADYSLENSFSDSSEDLLQTDRKGRIYMLPSLPVRIKILQARLQQYVNCEHPDFQAGFRKGRGTRHQIANIRWIMEKAREFQKNISFCFIDYAKAFDCVDHNKLWKILKEIGIPDLLICFL